MAGGQGGIAGPAGEGNEPAGCWRVRILDHTSDEPVGAGVLLTGGQVLTCAHVVAQALDGEVSPRRPDRPIQLDFPELSTDVGAARVAVGGWFPAGLEPLDLAILELTAPPPPGAEPVGLATCAQSEASTVRAHGYPASGRIGLWAEATLIGPGGRPGWYQLDGTQTAGVRIESGFSGAGVWDPRRRAVIGLVVAQYTSAASKVAWMVPVDPIVAPPELLPVVPEAERQELRELLVRLDPPDLHAAFLEAVEPGPDIPLSCPSAWAGYRFLEARNNRADGLPPCLVFVEALARRGDDATARLLRAWNDRQAARLNVSDRLAELRRTRPEVTPSGAASTAYLVVQLERHGRVSDHYWLRYWRHTDPTGWNPVPGTPDILSMEQIERRVEELVVEAETELAAFPGQIVLEFVLPRELLNLRVDQWSKHSDTPHPTPLGMEYPVVLRSLDRMHTRQWHRPWRRRWQERHVQPDRLRAYESDGDLNQLERSLLSDHGLLALVLGSPPAVRGDRHGVDEVVVALRHGVPVLVWHRSDCRRADFRRTVRWLLDGTVSELPEKVRQSRLRALPTDTPFETPTDLSRDTANAGTDHDDGGAEHDFAVLVDDPDRPLDLIVPPAVP